MRHLPKRGFGKGTADPFFRILVAQTPYRYFGQCGEQPEHVGTSSQNLRHCRRAMNSGGRLLLVEALLPEGNAPHPGKLFDMIMLTVPGGEERTATPAMVAREAKRHGCPAR